MSPRRRCQARSKLEKSKSEIRRLIKGNAIKLNDKMISDEKFIISDKLFQNNFAFLGPLILLNHC